MATADDNYNVDTAIDQILFDAANPQDTLDGAEEAGFGGFGGDGLIIGTPTAATTEQLGRLRVSWRASRGCSAARPTAS